MIWAIRWGNEERKVIKRVLLGEQRWVKKEKKKKHNRKQIKSKGAKIGKIET